MQKNFQTRKFRSNFEAVRGIDGVRHDKGFMLYLLSGKGSHEPLPDPVEAILAGWLCPGM